MKYSRFSYLAGSTLLEVLLSVVILAVGLTGVMRSFFVGIQAQRQTQGYVRAAVLLDNQLTALLVARYIDPETVSAGEFDGNFSGYRYEISSEAMAESELLKKVGVKIFWPGPQQEYVLEAETYLFAALENEGDAL